MFRSCLTHLSSRTTPLLKQQSQLISTIPKLNSQLFVKNDRMGKPNIDIFIRSMSNQAVETMNQTNKSQSNLPNETLVIDLQPELPQDSNNNKENEEEKKNKNKKKKEKKKF